MSLVESAVGSFSEYLHQKKEETWKAIASPSWSKFSKSFCTFTEDMPSSISSETEISRTIK